MSDEILISRKDAKAAGLQFYFTGKACRRGHVADRFVSNGICVECSRQYYQDNAEALKQANKRWSEENPDYWKKHSKRYREEDIEKARLRGKDYYENNAEARKQHSKQYREKNRSRVNANCAKRKATKLQATPSWAELDLILKVYEKRDEINSKWGTDYEVDHIIPLQSKTVCGLHVWANLQLLEAKDNTSKFNNYQQDW